MLPLLLLLPLLCAPTGQAADDPGEAELVQQIETIVRRGVADKAFWGLEVFAPERGRTLYARNAHRYFAPASVAKLFTTAAALELLGPDHRFHTLVGSRSRINGDGRLLGNLHLVGGGDPDLAGCALPYTLEYEERECAPIEILDRLAQAVADKGVRTITGDLILDQSFFSPEPYPPGWEVSDLLWSHGAPVRALSLADNVLTIRVEPGEQVNDRGRLTWEPFTRFYEIQNQVWTASPRTETLLWVRRQPGSRVLEVSGPIALDHPGRKLQVAIEEPAEFVGELFRQALERHGVRLLGKTKVQFAPLPPFPAEQSAVLPVVLAEHVSRPLVEDVTLINKVSHNLHAEMLLRLLGRLEPPQAPLRPLHRRPYEPPPRRADGSTEAGLGVLRAWLANAGVNPNDVELHDGSGLSRRDLVTPHGVVRLLRYVEAQPWRPLFVDSLPVAGVDGTLETRMKHSAARGRVQAKTGSLGQTNALAGFVQTLSGERLVVALFVNHHTLEYERALELLDEICDALVALPPAQATETGN